MSSEHGRILDLGIGRGGPYIEQDGPEVLRVGMDMYVNRLKKVAGTHRIATIQADANVESKWGLPFRTALFDSVEIKFPHNELLLGLVMEESPLWNELHRVVKPDGFIEVVFDVPKEGYREIEFLDGSKIRLRRPEDRMWRRALAAGFFIAFRELNQEETKRIGTDFANRTAKYMRKDARHKSYILRATPKGGAETKLGLNNNFEAAEDGE